MKLGEMLGNVRKIIQDANPITPRFMLWYLLLIALTAMAIVAIQIIPSIQANRRLNEAIQQGQVYIRGYNPALEPKMEDFILRDDGNFRPEPQHPLRPVQDQWSEGEVSRYWDSIDQQKLGELGTQNRRQLEATVRNLP